MSYDAYESSSEGGKPIRFYRFTLGSTVWRYAVRDEDVTIDGVTWKARVITDDGVKQTGDATTDALNITAPMNIGPAVVYQSSPPSTPIKAEILEMHEGMVTPRVIYSGEVVQVNPSRPAVAVLTCQTLTATMQRQGLRLGWQKTCPYDHYNPLTCKVPKASHALNVTIQSISGFNVTVSGLTGQPNNKFAAGMMEWTHPVRGAYGIMIEAQTGSVLTMFDDTSDLYPGLQVTIYPGCARTQDACRSFNNIVNYGGCPNMPGKSPYDGLNTPFF